MSCRARSLQDLRDPAGTLLSSSQYRDGECPNNAAGVACVILVLVTMPVAFPATDKFSYSVRTEHDAQETK